MIYRKLKFKLKSKFALIFISLLLISFMIIFLSFKDELFYNGTQYMGNYFDYYVKNYLNGNYNNLYLYGFPKIYVEGNIKYAFSSIFIYGTTFMSSIYPYILIISLIFIFHKITRIYYDDIYNNASMSKIGRIGIKRYIQNNLLSDSIFFGLLMVIPKLIYLIILAIFLPNGLSLTHMITNMSIFNEMETLNIFNNNIFFLIGIDLLISFIFGMFIYYLSLLIVLIVKNKTLSYFTFIGAIIVLVECFTLLKITPIIWYGSIFLCFKYTINNFNIFMFPLIIGCISLVMYFICNVLYKNSVRNNI